MASAAGAVYSGTRWTGDWRENMDGNSNYRNEPPHGSQGDWRADMGEKAKKWLAEQLREKQIPLEVAAAVLDVPLEDICVGSGRLLDSDDFMRICSHYHISLGKINID